MGTIPALPAELGRLGLHGGDLPHDALARARMFFVSGISQGISATAARCGVRGHRSGEAGGGRVAYDTNYRPRLWPSARAAAVMDAAIAQGDFVFPGMEDAQALLGLPTPTRSWIFTCAWDREPRC